MPRPALLNHPVRLHIHLEKRTLDKLRRLAKERAKNITEMLRELADSYANGRVIVREASLDAVVARIRAFRRQGGRVTTRSEALVRHLRDLGA